MKSYYFTFGCGHPLRKFVQRIFASSESKARETMHRFYADRWARCYGPYSGVADCGEDGLLDPYDRGAGTVDLGGYKCRKIEMDLQEGETL